MQGNCFARVFYFQYGSGKMLREQKNPPSAFFPEPAASEPAVIGIAGAPPETLSTRASVAGGAHEVGGGAKRRSPGAHLQRGLSLSRGRLAYCCRLMACLEVRITARGRDFLRRQKGPQNAKIAGPGGVGDYRSGGVAISSGPLKRR